MQLVIQFGVPSLEATVSGVSPGHAVKPPSPTSSGSHASAAGNDAWFHAMTVRSKLRLPASSPGRLEKIPSE